MRRRLGAVALAAVLMGGCGGQSHTTKFSDEASATCTWVRQSVHVVPERSSQLLERAAYHLRGLPVSDGQRAAADTLVARLGHLSRAADGLMSAAPDSAQMRRWRAAARDDQEQIAAAARTLGVSGCEAMAAVLPRGRAATGVAADGEVTANLPRRLSRAAYRTRLRAGVGDLRERTDQVEAAIRSGHASFPTLAGYAASIGAVVGHIRSLRPPASVAPAHRDFVAGLRALRTATARGARDLRAGRRQRATRALKRFYASQAFEDLKAADSTLTRRGYLPA